jgi:hypothetical protein
MAAAQSTGLQFEHQVTLASRGSLLIDKPPV